MNQKLEQEILDLNEQIQYLYTDLSHTRRGSKKNLQLKQKLSELRYIRDKRMQELQEWIDYSEIRSIMDLSSKLSEARLCSLETILEMSSLSLTQRERMAWLALYKLWRFIETHHYFPDKKEQGVLLNSDFVFKDKEEESKLDAWAFWAYRESIQRLQSLRNSIEEENQQSNHED